MLFFEYDKEPTSIERLGYDPEKIIQKIEETVNYLKDRIKIAAEIERVHEFKNDIKPSSIYCTLNITFTSDVTKLSGTMQVLIPEIRGFTVIKGIKRFVQNQIRDLLFYMIKNKSCKLICEYPSMSMYFTKDSPVFSIEGNPTYAIPLYFAIATETENGVDLSRLEKIEGIEESVEQVMQITKKDDYFKLMSQVRNTSINRSKYVYELLQAMYATSPLLKENFTDAGDIVLSMMEKAQEPDDENGKKIGLNLTSRRVRTVQEIVTYNLTWEIITKVLYNRHIISKQRRDLNCTIDPFRGIYDFVLTETMFNSPLVNVSNKFRVVLTGQGGFNKDNVPLAIKDIHPTQFRNICPIVTPDREKAGIVLYLAYSSQIDEFGRFTITPLKGSETLENIDH